MHRHIVTIGPLGLLTVLLLLENVVCAAESQQARPQQTETSKGLTVEDLARGVRSAAQSIEKEIPKIGPAIGKTVRAMRENSSENTLARQPPPDKK